MRLEEPEVLVEAGCDFIEKIGGHLIVEIVGDLDRLPRRLGCGGERIGQLEFSERAPAIVQKSA